MAPTEKITTSEPIMHSAVLISSSSFAPLQSRIIPRKDWQTQCSA
jgi:hypothetical protein